MASRAEITVYARAYVKAGKKDKGRVLGEVVDVMGWSRDNPRRRLTAASIDRYLAPAKPSPLRSSVTIRKAGDEVEVEPGFFESDTVTHCGGDAQGRVRPHGEPDLRAHRVDVHPDRA